MNTKDVYSELKEITIEYIRGHATKALTAQMLVDTLYRIDAAAKTGDIAKSDKNRHFVLILQHLSLVLRSPGTRSPRNWVRPGNLLLNSRPTLVITGVDFSHLSLPEFNISTTLLINCNFDGSDLRAANFGDCQLRRCSFQHADLSDADFRRTTLYECGFESADARSAKGIG